MKKVTTLLFLLAFSSHCVIAQMDNRQTLAGQNTPGQPGLIQSAAMNSFLSRVSDAANQKETVGSPYADARWLVANLKMSNNVQLPPTSLRYDVLNKRLTLPTLNFKSDSLQFNDSDLLGFELIEPATRFRPEYKRNFRRFRESTRPSQTTDYVEVIFEGPVSLLKHYEKRFIEGGPSNGIKQSIDRINDKITYYLVEQGKEPVAIKLSAKALQKALPAKAEALAALPSSKNAKTDQEWSAVLAELYR